MSFYFHINTKKCTSIHIFMLKWQITPKIKKKINDSQVTCGIHWKIFATVLLCFIAGKWHGSENIATILLLCLLSCCEGMIHFLFYVLCFQGCMNNITFGDENFGHYETVAGGAGAVSMVVTMVMIIKMMILFVSIKKKVKLSNIRNKVEEMQHSSGYF